jgi:hypothetical protein
MRLVSSLVALLVPMLAGPSLALAQSDWGRAEDEAIGDHTEDTVQGESLAPPEDEEERDREGGGGDEEEDEGDDADGDAGNGDGDDDASVTGLFGTTDAGGAIRFFGDVGTFFGPATVFGGMGAVGGTDVFSLSPWFGISYGVTDKLVLGAEWGFSMLAHGDVALISGMVEPGGASLAAGNPTIFARWIPPGSQGELSWGIDLALAFPVSNPESAAEIVAVTAAIGSRGAWDLYHWIDGSLSIVPGFFLEWEALEGFVLRGEADLGLVWGVANNTYETVGFLQIAIDASYRLAEAFALGLRLSGVLMGDDASPTRDTFQLSMAPYLAVFARPLFIRGEFLLNITEPYGTSFNDNRYWGARLIVGVEIE